jgi:hypothetical protein
MSVDSKVPQHAISASRAANKGGHMTSKRDDDNTKNQLNPNNDAYWQSRGWDERPEDWEQRQESGDLFPKG